MNRIKLIYLGLLIILGLLIVSISYQVITQTFSSTVTQTSRQEVVTVGEELYATFKIYNPDGKPHNYIYALYLNDEKQYENTAIIRPKKSLVFGGNFKSQIVGEIKITALVYRENKENLIKNITYFVNVEQ